MAKTKKNKPFYFTVQSWMLDEMELPLGDAAVYAYIHGLTRIEDIDRRGWRGSIRRLAKILHTSPSTMNGIVNRLEQKGFLHLYNGVITSTINRELAPGTPKVRASVQNPDKKSVPEGSDIPF